LITGAGVADQEQDDFEFSDISSEYIDGLDVGESSFGTDSLDMPEPEVLAEEQDLLDASQPESDIDLNKYVKEKDPDKFESPAQKTAQLPYIEEQPIEDAQADVEDAVEEWKTQIKRTMEDQGYSKEQIDEAITNAIPDIQSSGGGGSRIMTSDPTLHTFLTALQAEEIAMESEEGFFDGVAGFFSEADPSTMIQARDLIEQGQIELTDPANIRYNELIKEGKPEDEALSQVVKEFDDEDKESLVRKLSEYQKQQRDLGLFKVTDERIDNTSLAMGVLGATTLGYQGLKAGAKLGVKFGPRLGPIGALGLAALGATGGYALGTLGTKASLTSRFDYEGEQRADIPYLQPRKTMEGNFSILQSIVDDLGYVEDVETVLKIAPKRLRASLVTKVIALADEYGVSRVVSELPSFENFIEFASSDFNFLEKIAEKSGVDPESPLYASMQTLGETKYEDYVMPSLKVTRLLYHPTIRKILLESINDAGLTDKETEIVSTALDVNNFAGSLFGFDLDPTDDDEGFGRLSVLMSDIVNEVSGTDRYREEKAAARQKEIDDLRESRAIYSRERKVSYAEKDLVRALEKDADGIKQLSDHDKKVLYRDFVNSHSWNQANPKWRGEQPDVDRFIDWVKGDIRYGLKQESSNPKIALAYKLVRDDAPKKEIQDVLNNIKLVIVDQLKSSNITPLWDRPSDKEIEKFGLSLKKVLHEDPGGGRKASKEMEKTLQTLMFTRGYGTLYEPTLFNKILGIAALAPTFGSEADLAVELPEGWRPIVESIGLPMVWGTPAGVDFLAGDGLRPINSTHAARVRARRKSLTGGYQLGYEEIMLARGYERDDIKFNLASAAGFFLDLLNYERRIGKVIGNAAVMGRNTYPAVKAFK
jgi:hypothetical protein